MRLGLCCTFLEQDIRFRQTTARAMSPLAPQERAEKLRELARHNAAALREAIQFCAAHGIGSFRVNSQILPLRTHPELGYDASLLGDGIVAAFRAAGRLARETSTRLTFHPDQFVVLSSPRPEVVAASLAELEHQAEVAAWIGADVINIHGGGGYGDHPAALRRLADSVERLSDGARRRLTLENDDRIYAPRELLPVCRSLGIPLVYDVHHHRCHGDGMSVDRATEHALRTWDREPLFHLSSPRDGWAAPNPRPHHDHIDPQDFPPGWVGLDITVEVEAKAKERAVLEFARTLESGEQQPAPGPPAVPLRRTGS